MPVDIEAAKKAFAQYDVDGDGQITLEGYLYSSQIFKRIQHILFQLLYSLLQSTSMAVAPTATSRRQTTW